MSGIAVIIPAVLRVDPLLQALRGNIGTFAHPAVARIIVVCNGLTLMRGPTLEALLSREVPVPVQVIHDTRRSVAGAWNRGIEIAMDAGIGQFHISAVDVRLHPDAMEKLLRFGERHPETDIWSSTNQNDMLGSCVESVEMCDFSSFMLRKRTIDRHGWFDREYTPAYFEDNDYVTRVVLGGSIPRKLTSARHVHLGSATIKMDGETVQEVGALFGANQQRFYAKWKDLTDWYEQIPARCFSSPFNSGKPLCWWPEQERPGYSVSAGLDE